MRLRRIRPWAAACAAGCALLLLGPTGTTLARWTAASPVGSADIGTGHLSATSTRVGYELQSMIPAGQRTALDTGTACTPAAGYQECRSFTPAQLADVALVPGDRIVIANEFTVSAAGDNLAADVTLDGEPAKAGLPPRRLSPRRSPAPERRSPRRCACAAAIRPAPSRRPGAPSRP